MLKLWNANAGKWNDYTDPNSLPPDLHLTASLEEWESWFLGYTVDKKKKKHPVRWPAGRFKKYVLEVALKELAELYPKSTITLTPTKRGRRVIGYTLEIRQMNTTLATDTVIIDGKVQPPRNKGKQGVTD
ncbi:replication initiation protein, partial [Ligilactobacillus salivarius]